MILRNGWGWLLIIRLREGWLGAGKNKSKIKRQKSKIKNKSLAATSAPADRTQTLAARFLFFVFDFCLLIFDLLCSRHRSSSITSSNTAFGGRTLDCGSVASG